MAVSVIDKIKQSLNHDKTMINGLRGEIMEKEKEIRYYQGRQDSTNEILDILNDNKEKSP